MKKLTFIDRKEALSLAVILISWLLVVVAKEGALLSIKELPLPIALFWVGTGLFLAPFLFKWLMRIEVSPWKGGWKGLPLICSLLIAYELYFFSVIPMEKENQPYFFMWVLPLFWVSSILFFGKRRGFIRFRLLLVALLVLIALNGGEIVPLTASLFLLLGALMAFQYKGKLGSLLLQGSAVQIFIAGSFSFFHWQSEGSIKLHAIYISLGGGVIVGLALLFFLHAFTRLRLQAAVLGMGFSLLADLAFRREEALIALFCVPLLFMAAMTMRYVKIPSSSKQLPSQESCKKGF